MEDQEVEVSLCYRKSFLKGKGQYGKGHFTGLVFFKRKIVQ